MWKRDVQKKPYYDMKVTFSRLDDITAKTRARANRVNLEEEARLKKMQKIIEKDERYKSNVLNRIFTKSEKSHKQLRGYERVLNEDYKARSFNMLHNRGYKRPWVQSPKSARRFAQETRIYCGGYDRRNFEKEIERKIRQVDPTRVHKIFHKIMTEKCQERSNFVVDRNLDTEEFYSRFKQKMNPHIRVDRHGKHITVDMRESSLSTRNTT